MGAGASITLRRSLLERIHDELKKPLDATDVSNSENIQIRKAHMLDEVRRLRSLLALSNSGRRMSIRMGKMEDINKQVAIVRNLARDKQRILMNKKRKQKEENFEKKLLQIPKRQSHLSESTSVSPTNNKIAAANVSATFVQSNITTSTVTNTTNTTRLRKNSENEV